MINAIKQLNIKSVLENIISVFSMSLIFTFFIAFYFLGLLHGYAQGQKNMQEKVSVLLENFQNSKQTSSTLEPVATATPTPVTVARRRISWGGPELWESVNKRRAELGVNQLSAATELCTIASIRLNELLDLGNLDGHVGFSNLPERRPDLKWIFDKYGNIAEFLAMGGETADETVSLWENTLGHSKLLRGGEFVWGCIYAQNTFAVAITAY